MNDDRIKKTTTPTGRADRATEDESRRPPEDVSVSAEQRRKMWRDSWTQSALPQLQTLPGWHLCWLSTINQYDTIEKRIKLGYVPVKAEELGLNDSSRVKDGEYAGFVSCNEMLLYKIPMDVYQEVMTMMHHDTPNEDAANIRRKVEEMQEKDNNGRVLGSVEGDGLAAIAERKSAPIFAG